MRRVLDFLLIISFIQIKNSRFRMTRNTLSKNPSVLSFTARPCDEVNPAADFERAGIKYSRAVWDFKPSPGRGGLSTGDLQCTL
jgi:hypothetical protein